MFHLASDGSEYVHLASCVRQGGSVQAGQDLAVDVRRRSCRRYHRAHCCHYSCSAFHRQGQAGNDASVQPERRSFRLFHQSLQLLTCIQAMVQIQELSELAALK